MKSRESMLPDKGLIVLILLLSYVFIGNMLAVFSTALPYRDLVRLFISIIGCCFLCAVLLRNVVRSNNILLIELLFLFFTIWPTIFYYIVMSPMYMILQVGDSVLWIGVFAWAYYVGLKYSGAVYGAKWIAAFVPLYSILFLGVKQFSAGQGIPLISTAYYALFLLPFVLMLKSNLLKWPLVFLTFSTVLLSGKRGGFIAFVLSVAIYFCCEIKYGAKKYSKRKQYMIFGGLVLIIGLYAFFSYYISVHSLGILDRLLSIRNDGGSGRNDVWRTTWNMISHSGGLHLLMGHGFNSVYLDSPLGLSAHNDLLEVIYDYGIIGVILYILLWKQLLTHFRIIKKERVDLAAPYAVSLVLFLCMSAAAHLIIYPTHFLFLCLFWGLIIGELDRNVVRRRKFKWTRKSV